MPEWSRPERVDAVGEEAKTIAIEADGRERAALARRFGLLGVERLAASFTVRREAAGVLATGRITGEVVQACSVTGEPLAAPVDEPVTLRFVELLTDCEEVELTADALDTVEIEGGSIDLGEAAAETMALALDPFPRSPNAAAALKAAGVKGEEETSPFGALAELKAKLERR